MMHFLHFAGQTQRSVMFSLLGDIASSRSKNYLLCVSSKIWLKIYCEAGY